MSLNINPPEKLKITCGDKEYFARRPTLTEAVKVGEKVSAAKDDSWQIMDIAIEFMVELGLPKEFVLGLELDSFQDVFDALVPKKKSA